MKTTLLGRHRALSLLLSLTLLALMPSLRASPAAARIPVLDLRARIDPQDLNVAQLRRGAVLGVVVPIPRRTRQSGSLSAAYFGHRTLLSLTPELYLSQCRERADGIGTWLSVEASGELGRAPSKVDLWVTRGARIFGLASPVLDANGLTEAGRLIATRALSRRALLDVSGMSEASMAQVLELAEQARLPVIASHSNLRSLADHPRNLTDAQARRIAAGGGVIGITFDQRLLARGGGAGLPEVVKQVLYAIKTVGADHVAIGSGFGERAPLARDLVSPTSLPRLALALEQAGLDRVTVTKVFHDNAWKALCPARK